jgi:hypothetical protein
MPLRLVVVLVSALTGCELPSAPIGDSALPSGSSEQDVEPNAGRLPEPEASKSQVCADDGLTLTRWDYATFHRRFRDVCCGPDGLPPDHARCTTPPLGDRPTCVRLQELRYSIVARYGQIFTEPALNNYFGAQPWYTPDASFHVNDLSVTAKRNVLTLESLVRNGDCEPAG